MQKNIEFSKKKPLWKSIATKTCEKIKEDAKFHTLGKEPMRKFKTSCSVTAFEICNVFE